MMKKPKAHLLTIIVLAMIFTSCQKQKQQQVTVIKNCTGTYLRWQQKDYKVCNLSEVSTIEDGTTATATFVKIKKCTGEASEAIVCHMVYPYEGWVEVKKINL